MRKFFKNQIGSEKNKKLSHPIAFKIVVVVVSLAVISNFLNGLCIILSANDVNIFQKLFNTEFNIVCKYSYYDGLYSFSASILAAFLLIGFIKLKKWAWSAFMIWGGINLIQLLMVWYYGNPNYFGMISNSLLVYILNLKLIKDMYEIK